jgi:EPS-associated MarR family transcriptional regulator
MNKNNPDRFEILRRIVKQPESTQRDLARDLDWSLGKVNYCLKALKVKGFIKIYNFNKNPNKINYIYILTPKGIKQKTKLTINFMKRKIKEYEELKSELSNDYKKIKKNENKKLD